MAKNKITNKKQVRKKVTALEKFYKQYLNSILIISNKISYINQYSIDKC